ncbi:hypothetical protein [Streptomyces sp. NPDC013457]|uniref:hypothetical protein n=1 Tax=Streptomyces sp. NPDC013457 TaxID=3364866 RepID=UPI0036FE4C04
MPELDRMMAAVRTSTPQLLDGASVPVQQQIIRVSLHPARRHPRPAIVVMVAPADLHYSHAAKDASFSLRLMHPEITIVWADLANAGASS